MPEKQAKPGAYHSYTDRVSDRHESLSALDTSVLMWVAFSFATTKFISTIYPSLMG